MKQAALKWAIRYVLPPLVVLASLLIIWQGSVMLLAIQPFLLPSPARIAVALYDEAGAIARAAAYTGLAALTGLAISVALACSSAGLFSQSGWVRRGFNPYAICLQTTPIVSIAPLIIIWLGEGWNSVVAIAAIISFFPVLTNVTQGLTGVPSGLQDLFRLYRASRWQRLWKLQVPNALPSLVAGLKTSGGLAVLGAIVGEFFAGFAAGNPGLGTLIYQYRDSNTPLMFGCIVVATLLGVFFFTVISVVGDRCLLYWCDRRIGE